MKKTLSLLLVEDDSDDIELLRHAFTDSNTEVFFECILEGNKVLPYLEMCKIFPDLIILDLNLPKMHGRDVLVKIKSSLIFKNLPVVILTTSSAKSDVDFCIEAGADLFMIKPVTMEGYAEIVKSISTLALKGQLQKSN